MTINTILESKKVKSIQINSSQKLLESLRGVIITDLVVSKGAGRMAFRMVDSSFNFPILWVEKEGTFNYSFPEGFKFWKEASLEVINNSKEPALIVVGYFEYDAPNQQKWRTINGN